MASVIACNDASSYAACAGQSDADKCEDDGGAGADTVRIYANVSGTGFTFQNTNPTGRGKVSWATNQHNVPEYDWSTTMDCGGGGCYDNGGTEAVDNAPTATANGVAIFHLGDDSNESHLETTITVISGNTLTIAAAATNTTTTGQIVYHNAQVAFEAARDALPNSGEDGVIFAPAGTYYMASDAGFDGKEVSLRGVGYRETILVKPRYKGDYAWEINEVTGNADNIEFRGVRFDGDSEYPDFRVANSYGVNFLPPSASVFASKILIENCAFTNFSKFGLRIGNADDVKILHSRIYRCHTGAEFYISNSGARDDTTSKDIIVANSTIDQCAHIGLNFYGINTLASPEYSFGRFENLQVINNTFRDCYQVGVEFYANTYGSSMASNKGYNCGWNSTFGDFGGHGAFVVKYSSDIQVYGNYGRDNYQGIEILGHATDITNGVFPGDRLQIKLNQLFNNKDNGIDVANGASDLVIDGNLIDGSTYGISVGLGAQGADNDIERARIANNAIRDSRIGLYIVMNVGTDANSINRPEILGNSFFNINSWEEADTTRSAIVLQGYDADDQITNAVIQDNLVVDTRTTAAFNTHYPIHLVQDVAGCVIIQNRSSGCETDDVLEGATRVTGVEEYRNEWQTFGATGNPIYVEEGDVAVANSTGGGLTLDFDGGDFTLSEAANEVEVTIPDDGHAHTTTSLSGIVLADDVDAFSSANLAGRLSDETGTGVAVYSVAAAHTGNTTFDATTLAIDATGNEVGIGTASPAQPLHIYDADPRIRLTDTVDTNDYAEVQYNGAGLYFYAREYEGPAAIYFEPMPDNSDVSDDDDAEVIFFRSTNTAGTVRLRLLKGDNTNTPVHQFQSTGLSTFNMPGDDIDFNVEGDTDTALLYVNAGTDRVGIGDSTPGYKLEVAGTFHATGAITSGGACCVDYVFDDDYPLMSLDGLKSYIEQNSHLPNMTQGVGDEVGETTNINHNQAIHELLVKTEEQALYILQLNKRLLELESK